MGKGPISEKRAVLLGVNSKITQTNLALPYLKAAALSRAPGWEIEILEASINQPYMEILSILMDREWEVLGVSCYIWNIDLVRKLLQDLRALKPDCTFVLGGHEVSHDPKTYLEEGLCDFVIVGEGEFKFSALLNGLTQKGFDFKELDDTWFLNDNQVVPATAGGDIDPLNSIPSPFELEENWLQTKTFTYYESSRGCVYKCHFCLSALDRGSRFFSMDRFHSDMEKILSMDTIRQVKFVDRTFNLNEKRSNQIFEYLLEFGGGRNFHFEVQAELFKPSTLEILKRVPDGMFQFEVGIQSTNQEVLNENGRACRLEKLLQNLGFLKENTKVHLHLDLIAGLANETPAQFQNSFNRLLEEKPNHLQIEVIKLLKGSIARNLAPLHRMKYQQSPPYTLLQSKDWDYKELNQVQEVSALLEIYYNREKIKASVETILAEFESPWDFFSDFSKFFFRRHPSRTGISLQKAFEILYEFIKENDLLNQPFLEAFSLDYLKEFPFGGKLPFPKVSRTLSRQKYLEIAREFNLNNKGFIEIFHKNSSPVPIYFPGKAKRTYQKLVELLNKMDYQKCLDLIQAT